MNEQTVELRRIKFRSLFNEHFSGIHGLAAETIETATGKKVSERTIQAWLVSPNRVSSRNCPEWILKILQDYLANPSNRENIANQIAARKKADADSPTRSLTWSERVRSEKAVEFATNEIEHADRRLRHWQTTLGLESGKTVYELERAMEIEHHSISQTLYALHTAITQSTSFESFAQNYKQQLTENAIVRMYVDETRRAILAGTEEFSNDDGMPA